MKKDNQQTTLFTLQYLALLFLTVRGFTQTASFDVCSYQPSEFFTKSEQLSRLPFNLSNNDTSFCTANVTNIIGGDLK